ncbi:MAG TPA: ribosome biogenesis factor YjgA [Rhodanobacteraceae bacterium]|nr:ribosome biogenesis factor YjgA [Rhodanobacteraceae bacterium]
MDPDEPDDRERPSRSARRRDALDVLALAGQLAALPAARLTRLQLPDDVRERIADVRRTPSHIAHKRELAHLAKTMRAHDPEEFQGAREALANAHGVAARDAAALHQIETLRERLLGVDAEAALTEFIAAHPEVDRQRLRNLIRQAHRERDAGQPPRAQRELFRYLRDVEQPARPAAEG